MDSELQKMAHILITYSTAVKPGERVLIRATSPTAEPLVQALYQEALRAGGYAFTYIHLREEDSLALEATTNPNLLGSVNPMLELMYQTCDVIIRIDAAENPVALSAYDPALQKARVHGHSAVMKIQMEREGNGSLRRCTTLFPTQGYAQAAGMSLRQFEEFVFSACMLDLADPVAGWRAMHAEQQRLIDYLAGKKHIQVRGDNIDLELSIEGRSFANSSGLCNFPDGEIYTGPVENSVNGRVKFTYPAYYLGNQVLGAELFFEKGLVVKAKAEKNLDYLLNVLDTDPGARRVGEFAIGTNTHIQRFTGSILFDEKIGGTVHLAVGQGYTQTGSTNQSAVHWDMICDMRGGGEILVDGKLFYKNGHFTV